MQVYTTTNEEEEKEETEGLEEEEWLEHRTIVWCEKMKV